VDRLTSAMARISFAWLVAGVVLGGLMLADRVVPGDWRAWAAPTHAHVLFVGWFVQFVVGIAYWLLPRRRTAERPIGYGEPGALLAAGALNLGLLLRVAAEPAARVGRDGSWTQAGLVASAVLQVGAVAVFVAQLWPRVGARPTRTPARIPVAAPQAAVAEAGTTKIVS
jgi:hypothetical protein